jgi:hypothetical protein
VIDTWVFFIPVLVLERGLSAMIEADIVFKRCQLLLKCFEVECDGVGHIVPFVSELYIIYYHANHSIYFPASVETEKGCP